MPAAHYSYNKYSQDYSTHRSEVAIHPTSHTSFHTLHHPLNQTPTHTPSHATLDQQSGTIMNNKACYYTDIYSLKAFSWHIPSSILRGRWGFRHAWFWIGRFRGRGCGRFLGTSQGRGLCNFIHWAPYMGLIFWHVSCWSLPTTPAEQPQSTSTLRSSRFSPISPHTLHSHNPQRNHTSLRYPIK